MPAPADEQITARPDAAPARRTLALRWHFVLLVCGAVLPLAVFSVVVVYRLAGSERTAAERRLGRSARELSLALDREVRSTFRTLSALAESEKLDGPDLQPFHAEARRVASTQPGWLTVILLTPDGRQLVNTHVPWGTELPVAREPASLRRVVEQKRPQIGSLTPGILVKGQGFPVRVPVLRGGEVRYVLSAVITPAALASLFGLHDPANDEWTRTIVDAEGRIVARSREPVRFVGERVTPDFLRRLRESDEGLVRGEAIDGTTVYFAFSREPVSGWATAVALTAYAGESDRARALRSGFQAHLSKPVEPEALVAAIVNLAGRAAATDT